MIKLKCEICGVNYEKPAHYTKWNNVFFKWSLRFCDDCRRKKENEELTFRTSRIPEYKQTEKIQLRDNNICTNLYFFHQNYLVKFLKENEIWAY